MMYGDPQIEMITHEHGTPTYAAVADPVVETHENVGGAPHKRKKSKKRHDKQSGASTPATPNAEFRELADDSPLHTLVTEAHNSAEEAGQAAHRLAQALGYDVEFHEAERKVQLGSDSYVHQAGGHGNLNQHYTAMSHPGETKQDLDEEFPPLECTVPKVDPDKSPRALNEVKGGKASITQASPKKERTVLQKHCDFFDPDNDGIIWPLDTFFAFWVLGYGVIFSFFAMVAIHIPFSWPTQPRFPFPDLFGRIYIENIARDKHGSDSGAYDHEGGFDEVAFEKIFTNHAKTRKDAISGWELFRLIGRNRVLYDPFGWQAGLFEWLAVYILFWPADNFISKDDIRGIYDGSVFYKVAYEKRRRGRYTPPGWEATVLMQKKL